MYVPACSIVYHYGFPPNAHSVWGQIRWDIQLEHCDKLLPHLSQNMSLLLLRPAILSRGDF